MLRTAACMWEICLRSLAYGDEEAVREASRGPAMQRTSAVLVGLRQSLAVSAVDLHVATMGEVRRQFEAGCVDDAVEFEFLAIGDDAFLGDVIDADALN